MNIPTHELHAFYMVATVLSFSKAAKRIPITQSALSQRIQNLEQKLGLTLFVRDKKSIRLTEAGIRLLRFCSAKNNLEAELFHDLIAAPGGKLSGHLRVAGYSSIMHSVILPALASLLRDNPAIRFEFLTHNMDHLPNVLLSGEADFVIMDYKHPKKNLTTHILGYEHYELIQSKHYPAIPIYLDHHPNDQITKLFLKMQNKHSQSITRCYMDNIEGVINGVMLGLGQGVVPRHLIAKKMPLNIVKGFKAMNVPVVLHYFHQPYYSTLHQLIINTLTTHCEKYLTC